jgi:hypothetical protein
MKIKITADVQLSHISGAATLRQQTIRGYFTTAEGNVGGNVSIERILEPNEAWISYEVGETYEITLTLVPTAEPNHRGVEGSGAGG